MFDIMPYIVPSQRFIGMPAELLALYLWEMVGIDDNLIAILFEVIVGVNHREHQLNDHSPQDSGLFAVRNDTIINREVLQAREKMPFLEKVPLEPPVKGEE